MHIGSGQCSYVMRSKGSGTLRHVVMVTTCLAALGSSIQRLHIHIPAYNNSDTTLFLTFSSVIHLARTFRFCSLNIAGAAARYVDQPPTSLLPSTFLLILDPLSPSIDLDLDLSIGYEPK